MGIIRRFIGAVGSGLRQVGDYLSPAVPSPEPHEPEKRKGIGERIFSGPLAGYSSFGYPGGWSQDRIEQVLHMKQWVFVAIRAICSEVARQKPHIAHVTDTTPQVRRKSGSAPYFTAAQKAYLDYRYQKSMQQIEAHEEIDPVEPDHPLRMLMQNPNSWDTAGWSDVVYELVMYLYLCGNAYLWVPLNHYGLPAQMWVMPSQWTWEKLGMAGIEYYRIIPMWGPGQWHLPPEEVIPFLFKSPIHKRDGWSPLTAGSEWIDCDESTQRARFWQMKNGCFPVGAVELGEQYHDPDDDDIARIQAKFFARLQGETQSGRPIILPPGAKYIPLTIAPLEMAYMQTSDQLRDWVLCLFGVPKEIVGIQPSGSENSWYAPLQQFCRYTISNILGYLGHVLTRSLASRYDKKLRIWWDDPAPHNPSQVNADMDLDLKYGLLMPNEQRAIRGREPFTPEQEQTYSMVGKAAQQPPGQPGGAPGMAGAGEGPGPGSASADPWTAGNAPQAPQASQGMKGGVILPSRGIRDQLNGRHRK
jgi:HK97 family phage portal protein